MFKNCTRLWRDGHFQVKMRKKTDGLFKNVEMLKTEGLGALLEVLMSENLHAAVARSTFPSEHVD